MTRIEEEKQVVEIMVRMYCKAHHLHDSLCTECQQLLSYAHTRLTRCKYGNQKPTCKLCPIHCYRPEIRERMQIAMRYAGPRMVWKHPIIAFKHLCREIKHASNVK